MSTPAVSGPRQPHAVVADLHAVLEPPQLITDLEVVERYRRDGADWAEFGVGVPIVSRGAGTGVSGGANALDGCVVLCTERMCSIVDPAHTSRVAALFHRQPAHHR